MHKPVWELFADGTDKSVHWVDHSPNYRFALSSNPAPTTPTTPASPKVFNNEYLVWDKETGLIWPRNASLFQTAANWLDASTQCREITVNFRLGWRLPSVEELSSLVDMRNATPALPNGHPFSNVIISGDVTAYWTSTLSENDASPNAAWFVNIGSGGAGIQGKTLRGYAWPVRAGRSGR